MILKAGKEHRKTKGWRPINLINCIGKSGEKFVADRLQEPGLLHRHPTLCYLKHLPRFPAFFVRLWQFTRPQNLCRKPRGHTHEVLTHRQTTPTREGVFNNKEPSSQAFTIWRFIQTLLLTGSFHSQRREPIQHTQKACTALAVNTEIQINLIQPPLNALEIPTYLASANHIRSLCHPQQPTQQIFHQAPKQSPASPTVMPRVISKSIISAIP